MIQPRKLPHWSLPSNFCPAGGGGYRRVRSTLTDGSALSFRPTQTGGSVHFTENRVATDFNAVDLAHASCGILSIDYSRFGKAVATRT